MFSKSSGSTVELVTWERLEVRNRYRRSVIPRGFLVLKADADSWLPERVPDPREDFPWLSPLRESPVGDLPGLERMVPPSWYSWDSLEICREMI